MMLKMVFENASGDCIANIRFGIASPSARKAPNCLRLSLDEVCHIDDRLLDRHSGTLTNLEISGTSLTNVRPFHGPDCATTARRKAMCGGYAGASC